MKQCPKCLIQLDDLYTFCSRCGGPLSENKDAQQTEEANDLLKKECPSCKAINELAYVCCRSCGQLFHRDKEVRGQQPEATSVNEISLSDSSLNTKIAEQGDPSVVAIEYLKKVNDDIQAEGCDNKVGNVKHLLKKYDLLIGITSVIGLVLLAIIIYTSLTKKTLMPPPPPAVDAVSLSPLKGKLQKNTAKDLTINEKIRMLEQKTKRKQEQGQKKDPESITKMDIEQPKKVVNPSTEKSPVYAPKLQFKTPEPLKSTAGQSAAWPVRITWQKTLKEDKVINGRWKRKGESVNMVIDNLTLIQESDSIEIRSVEITMKASGSSGYYSGTWSDASGKAGSFTVNINADGNGTGKLSSGTGFAITKINTEQLQKFVVDIKWDNKAIYGLQVELTNKKLSMSDGVASFTGIKDATGQYSGFCRDDKSTSAFTASIDPSSGNGNGYFRNGSHFQIIRRQL